MTSKPAGTAGASDEYEDTQKQFDSMLRDDIICISDDSSDCLSVFEWDSDDDAVDVGSVGVSQRAGKEATQPAAELQSQKRKAATPPQQQQQQQQQGGGFRGAKSARLFEHARHPADESVNAAGQLPHPEGVVRLTQLMGEKKDGNTWYTFQDVVQPATLRKALMTTFVLDMQWLRANLGQDTKLVVVESYNPTKEPQGIFQSEGGRVTVVHPEFAKQRYPIMHSKVMLLFYDSYVRFVASSANLIEIDWTILGNIVFIQDVPFDAGKVFPPTEFGTSLQQALRDLCVPEQVVGQVRHMDLSAVKVEIVTSVPTAAGRSKFHASSYGLQRLGQIACRLNRGCLAGAFDPETTSLYCYGSSMGRLTHSFLCAFYSQTVGLSPAELEARAGRRPLDIERWVKVGFHTDSQGASNKFGGMSRNSIKCHPSNVKAGSFPTQVLHRVEPVLPDTLVHAKVMLMRTGDSQARGWMYLGSHNFTPGAWGSTRYPGSKHGGFSINNYEFGVVLPDVQFETMFGRDTVTWNGSKVPLPFKLSWTRYADTDKLCFSPS